MLSPGSGTVRGPGWGHRREALEHIPRCRERWVGHFKEPGEPMGALGQVLALRGERAVHFPDPGGVEDADVNEHLVVVERERGGFEAPLHERPSSDVIPEVDAHEHMRAVAAVGQEDRGGREAQSEKPVAEVPRPGERGLMLRVRRGDATRPDGIEVDGQPPPADDVGVACRRPGVHADAVVRALEKIALHWVYCHVDAGRLPAPYPGRVGELVPVGEVPGDGSARSVRHPELSHAARLVQKRRGATNLRDVGGRRRLRRHGRRRERRRGAPPRAMSRP